MGRLPKGLISHSDDAADLDTSILERYLNCQTLTRNHFPWYSWQSVIVNVTIGKTLKAKKTKKDHTQSSSNWTLLSRGTVNSDYNWVTSAFYKFSKTSLGPGGGVMALHDYISHPIATEAVFSWQKVFQLLNHGPCFSKDKLNVIKYQSSTNNRVGFILGISTK